MSLYYKTPDYFRDFGCLGGDCPDTCCQHWEVKLDRQHYEMLREKMCADPRHQEKFESYIRINDKAILGDHDYAHIHMADSGYCSMLGDDGLCEIHRDYGVEPLGNVCAFFPRVIVRRDNVVEMSGAMSCPEVSRLCLGSDKLPRLVKFAPSSLPRAEYPITRELPRNENDHYAQHFARVRDVFLSVISREEYSLDVRLYALASIANRISRFYHRDCEALDTELLQQELQRGESQDAFAQWTEYLQQYQSDEPLALIVIHSILQLKQQQFAQEHTSKLATRIFASLQQQVPAGNWLESFAQRQEIVSRELGKQLDTLLTRYMHNCLFREWFYTMPDSFIYIQMLLIRVAILRFLLTADPDVITLIDAWQQGEIDRHQLEERFFQLVVNTVYRFARDIDQNLPFLQVIYNAISEQEMMNFDYSLPFIKY